jgi:hypothetical protein
VGGQQLWLHVLGERDRNNPPGSGLQPLEHLAGAKVELAIQFYRTIAPVFTAEYFKALPPDQNESIFIELTP